MNEAALRFGGTVPPEIDRRLRDAAAAWADTPRAEALLDEALTLDPDCLPVYFARYKFYFYKSRLADAEHAVRQALDAAARRGGFPTDWTQLRPDSADWADARGAAHFYLFSLKALAFIRLRQGCSSEACALLAKLRELDARDSVGASVVRTLSHTVSAG